MNETFGSRLKHAWNAFMNRDPTNRGYGDYPYYYGGSSYSNFRPRLTRGNERSIVTSVINQIAIDVAQIDIKHVRLDDNNRYESDINSGLNECLTLSANLDQTGRAFKQDIVMSMLDEGHVAIVPVDTKLDPTTTQSIDITSMRTGKVKTWYPDAVEVDVYNEHTGRREDITLPKSMVAIVENPLYSILNEPNSTYQRLVRKLNMLDVIDEQTSSGKLDLLIQLPYTLKSEARQKQAEKRRKEIEMQLTGSKYGIAYVDSTEHITQLNRSVENNLMTQIEYLTKMLYSQLGISEEILNGTADEKTMLNYKNRTIEPIVSAIVDEMKRKFLSKTARSQRQSIECFTNPFKLVPVNTVAEIGDKFTRNEIVTSNEIRQAIGMPPAKDPKADQLVNSNISQSDQQLANQVDVNGNSVAQSQTGLTKAGESVLKEYLNEEID